MSGFTKFEDDEVVDVNISNKEQSRSAPDNTEAKWTHSTYNGDDSVEPRLNNMDYNFRRNPCLSTVKTIFPHFNLVSLSVGYAVLLVVFYILELIMWRHNRWR